MIRSSAARDLTQFHFETLPTRATADEKAALVVFVSSGFDLTNRDELIAQLVLDADASDDDILIEGWRAWGDALPDKLRGAFAFALYIPFDRSIYAARDIFGLSPLYYAYEKGSLILGSTCRAVRSLLPEQGTPNEVMLADFITEEFVTKEDTFFKEISRLPQAHHMRATSGSANISRYWLIEEVEHDRDLQDAPAEFRRLFDAAVSDCVDDGNPALMISGGMDSSAIAASMRSQNPDGELNAAAMTFPASAQWTDKEYLADITSHASLNLHEVPSDNHNPLADMEHWLAIMDGPYLPRGWSMSGRLLRIMRENGFTRALSGHGGDEIVSFGFGRMNELAMAGRWIELLRLTKGSGLHTGGASQRWRTLKRYFVHLRAYQALRHIRAKLKSPKASATAPRARSWLAPSLAKTIDTTRYDKPMVTGKRYHTERMVHEEVMSLGVQPLSLEVFAVCAHASDIQIRFPFYDRELLELCLSLPSDWKLRDGLTRYILRAAMGDDLPRSIQERVNKHNFMQSFLRGLYEAREEVLRWTDPDRAGLCDLVNRDTLMPLRDRLSQNDMTFELPEANFLWRVAVLGMWLEIAKQPLERPNLASVIKE